jgi:O-antigen biosynthesis protein
LISILNGFKVKVKIKIILARLLARFPIFGQTIIRLIYFLSFPLKFSKNLYLIFDKIHSYFAKLYFNHCTEMPNESSHAFLKYLKGLSYIVEEMDYKPKISIILPVYKVKLDYLKEAIDSVFAQTYKKWELCIVDDHSQSRDIEKLLESYQTRDPARVKICLEKENHHISISSNIAIGMASGDYIAFLDHDDRLFPNALGEVVRHINLKDKPDILYSDEMHINKLGDPGGVYYKPDFSPVLHLSVNYTTHFSVYSSKMVNKLGGLRKGFEGAQDHDFMLRASEETHKEIVHIPYVLYQWRQHEESTASSINNKSYCVEAGIKALNDALKRREIKGKVVWNRQYSRYRPILDINGNPKVSIIIPSKDGYEDLKKCLESIFEKTTYSNFEVVLINHETKCRKALDLISLYSSRSNFIELKYSGKFNFGKMNNFAVDNTSGDYLLFLNNDTEVITPSWLEEFLVYAQMKNIGSVGAKLLYRNNTVQHAGMQLMGINIAGHCGHGEDRESTTGCLQNNTVREVFGNTAACLMVSRAIFKEIGAFDEKWCPNGWGDVDFAIRLNQCGYSSIYTPYSELYHFESKTRGVSVEFFEHDYLIKKYGQFLLNDPYKNKNLLLTSGYDVSPHRKISPSKKFFKSLLDNPYWND